MRTSCGCATRRPQHELVRLHVDEHGALAVGPAPGRGAYVCPEEACTDALRARPGLLARSLRTRPSIPDALWQAVRGAAGGAATG
jgi:predicted RNA-binding protein YlxR (DUF448 family)